MKNGKKYQRRLVLDTSIFKAITSETTESDRKSILAIQQSIGSHKSRYAYLEIGSYKGGSLQPFLVDPKCTKIFSIDSRELTKIDERGETDFYLGNSTENMFKNLSRHYKSYVSKVIAINGKSSSVDPSRITPKPDIFFIDAEHIDSVVFGDFLFCLGVANKNAVILLHDVNMVIEGYQRCCDFLHRKLANFSAYILPSTLGVIEVGDIALYKHPAVLDRLRVSYESYLFGMKGIAVYRDIYKNYYKNPIVSLFLRGTARIKTQRLGQM